jgi:hypothetical protein
MGGIVSQDPANSTSIAIADRFNLVRSQIQQEDNLITQRLNWFLTSQSFLFTAYAIIATGPKITFANPRLHMLLMQVVPLLAIVVGVLILLAIVAGAIALEQLRRGFVPYEAAARAVNLPPVQGHRSTRVLGMIAPILLPITFVVIWAVLLSRA